MAIRIVFLHPGYRQAEVLELTGLEEGSRKSRGLLTKLCVSSSVALNLPCFCLLPQLELTCIHFLLPCNKSSAFPGLAQHGHTPSCCPGVRCPGTVYIRASAVAEDSSEVRAFLLNGLVCGRIYSLEMVGLRSSEACSQLLGPPARPCHVVLTPHDIVVCSFKPNRRVSPMA